MSVLTCLRCETTWDGARHPACTRCTRDRWMLQPGFIRAKHDPRLLPKSWPSFRSVLSNEFIQDQAAFVDYMTVSGTWYWSQRHQLYCHYTFHPIQSIPGSLVPAGYSMPTLAASGVVVADSAGAAHAYAVNTSTFEQEIAARCYWPLSRCTEGGCDNLACPNDYRCAKHLVPPQAK